MHFFIDSKEIQPRVEPLAAPPYCLFVLSHITCDNNSKTIYKLYIYIYTQKNIDTKYPYILKKTSFPLFPDEQSHHSCFVDRQTFLIGHFWNSQLAQHIPNSPYPFAEPCDVFDVCDVWPRRRMKRNGRNACSAGFAGIHPMTWIWCLGDFVYSSMVIYYDIIYIYI